MARYEVTATDAECDTCGMRLRMKDQDDDGDWVLPKGWMLVTEGVCEWDICSRCVELATRTMLDSMLLAHNSGQAWSVEDYGQGVWYAKSNGKCKACGKEYVKGTGLRKNEHYGWVHKDCAG